jgi:UDP-glucose 4-epimerase
MIEKKILVTGAGGFVGSVLIEKLQNKHDVIRAKRTCPSSCNGNEIAIGEINGKTDWSLALCNTEVVVHCAGVAHTNSSSEEYKAVNIDGTLNLARQALKVGIRKFIFISSVKVNGERTFSSPYTHIDSPEPADDYGRSKNNAEIGLRELFLDTNVDLIIIRPPLIYGPGVKANFATLISIVNKQIPMPFAQINKNKRSMVYLGNLIDLIERCIDLNNLGIAIFMVSDGDDLSTSELIYIIGKSLGKNVKQFPFPITLLKFIAWCLGRSNMVCKLTDSLQVDISETQTKLDWIPPFTVEQGIEETVNAFKKVNK